MIMRAASDATYGFRFGGHCLEYYRACVEPSGLSAMEVRRDAEGSYLVRPEAGSISAIAGPEDVCVGMAGDNHWGPAYRRMGSPDTMMNYGWGVPQKAEPQKPLKS